MPTPTVDLYVVNKRLRSAALLKNITTLAESDVTYYDGATYRDDMDASFTGVGWKDPQTTAVLVGSPADESDTFNHVSPRFWEKTRTEYQVTCLMPDLTTTYILKYWKDETFFSPTLPVTF